MAAEADGDAAEVGVVGREHELGPARGLVPRAVRVDLRRVRENYHMIDDELQLAAADVIASLR